MMEIKTLLSKYKNIIPYLFFGVCTTVINVLAYWAFAHPLKMPTMISTIFAWVVAVLFAYITNRKWVFHSTNTKPYEIAKEIWSFFVCRCLTGLVDLFCMFLFVEILGFNDVIIKFLANIIVIILNYIASKTIIFKREDEKNFKLGSSIKRICMEYWDLIVIILIFSGIVILYINIFPFYGTAFPDEVVHFNANVKFLIMNHRLPISGVDDLNYISAVRNNTFGIVNGIYSYNIYPQLNYIIAAAIAIVLHKVAGIPYQIGARYSALLWAIIFLIFLYKILKKVSSQRYIRGWITAIVAFIPGVIYISAYVSQDIHSLAISAILVYASILMSEQYKKKHIIFFGIACALLLVAKLNYMIYIPFVAGYFLYLYLCKKQYTHKQFWTFAISSGVIAFALSGFWYIRNFMLYHDFIGQKFLLQKMSEYGPQGTPQGVSFDTLVYLIWHNDITFFFQSFFMWLLGVGILPETYYILMELILVVILILGCKYLMEERSIRLWLGFGVFVLFVLGVLAMITFNSLKYDLEFQGRYLYPIIVPTVCVMAHLFDKRPKYSMVLAVMLGLCLMMSFKTTSIVLSSYAPFQLDTKDLGAVHAGTSQVIKDSETQNLSNGSFEQDFVATEAGLKSVSLQVSEILPGQNGSLHAKILDQKGNVLADTNQSLSTISKDDKIYLTLPNPLKESKNERYTISLKLENADSNVDLKFYCSAHAIAGDNTFLTNDQKQTFNLYYTTIYADILK